MEEIGSSIIKHYGVEGLRFVRLVDLFEMGLDRHLNRANSIYVSGWADVLEKELGPNYNLVTQDHMMSRVENAPETQIGLVDDDWNLWGFINGISYSEDFLKEFKDYKNGTGNWVFDNNDPGGNVLVCPNVVTDPKLKDHPSLDGKAIRGGPLLVLAGREAGVKANKRTMVLTRPSGYSDHLPRFDILDFYVSHAVTAEERVRGCSLNWHYRLSKTVRDVEFVADAEAKKIVYAGREFQVERIVENGRPADERSEGHCVLAEHKWEKIRTYVQLDEES